MALELRGVGIGLRRQFHDEILRTSRRIDWLEIIAENFMGLGGRPQYVLAQCRERWPIVPHGVALSVGGPDSMDRYLEVLGPLLDDLDAPFFSEHLCYASIGGTQSFDLLPLPFHEEAVAHAARRARNVAERLGRPLILENITCYAVMPGSEMTEPAFVRAVLDRADCGLLLDVNNLYLNATNHGIEAGVLLDGLPLERVRQIHLAGCSQEGDVLLDTHSSAVKPPVWDLYRDVIRRLGPIPTLIEWDQRIPSLDAVLDEADRARTILECGGVDA